MLFSGTVTQMTMLNGQTDSPVAKPTSLNIRLELRSGSVTFVKTSNKHYDSAALLRNIRPRSYGFSISRGSASLDQYCTNHCDRPHRQSKYCRTSASHMGTLVVAVTQNWRRHRLAHHGTQIC